MYLFQVRFSFKNILQPIIIHFGGSRNASLVLLRFKSGWSGDRMRPEASELRKGGSLVWNKTENQADIQWQIYHHFDPFFSEMCVGAINETFQSSTISTKTAGSRGVSSALNLSYNQMNFFFREVISANLLIHSDDLASPWTCSLHLLAIPRVRCCF